MTQLEEAPQIEVVESRDTYVRVVVEPLPPGFGITVGNAMRRVLLSSLPGAAIAAVRIDDVEHEFSTIPGMKEDTTEFMLNLKQVRLRGFSDRPGKLWLEAQGAGPVFASQIQPTADYEIVNPDLQIATLDAEDARLTAELSVERGVGYQPAGSVAGMPIGMIPVDAIFTPVRRANYSVERTRVGTETNHDRLVLEVWTDGTMNGVEAVAQSADILIRNFSLLSHLGRPAASLSGDRGLGATLLLPPDRYNIPIEDLNLSVRAYNCLKRSGLMTVGQVLEKSEDELLSLRNFGRKSYDELREKLVEMGFLDPSALTSSPPHDDTEEDVGEEEDEELGTLGAALMEALRGRGDNRNTGIDFLRRGENETEQE